MRVGIVGLLHESNTFIQQKTSLKHFEQDVLAVGERVRDVFAGHLHEISGFFHGLADHGFEAVPLFAARAYPFGIIEAKCFQRLSSMMIEQVQAAKDLDGILVAPHGATVAEDALDADGIWLQQVRQCVGDSIPIVGTLDPHANLSSAMVDSTDALVAYRTNPHIDQFDCGIQAADLMARTLKSEIRPIQHAEFPPMAINIERQLTSDEHMKNVYELADQQLEHVAILSNSILLGFPYADVEEMGSSTLVVSDGDKKIARQKACELSGFLWENRDDFLANFISVPDAIKRASKLEKPVCLLDMGDNVGGGSPGDGTFLLHALNDHPAKIKSLACIYDPQTVEVVCQNEIDAELELSIGGKSDRLHGDPFKNRFMFLSQHIGAFTESDVAHGGISQFDQGKSVVIQTPNKEFTLLVTSRRVPPFSINQFLSCGIDPNEFDLIIAKGVNAPQRSYSRYCQHFIKVNTDGSTSADMRRLAYKRRRKPLFPLD